MELSILLGQVFGVYMLVCGAAMLMRKSELSQAVKEFTQSKADMLFFGSAVLLFGLFIVLQHNIWDGTWRVIVTIFGWAALGKGLSFMLFPSFLKNLSKMFTKANVYTFAGVLWIILGGYLVAQTFPF